MAQYRTASNPGGHVPEGRHFPYLRPKYAYEIDKTGRKVLKKAGATNFYEQIQEGLHDNDVQTIVKRMEMGDLSALGDQTQGFIDALSLPKNLMEAENTRIQIENLFARLPEEERAKYGQDVYRFIKEVNGKIDERMNKAASEYRAQLLAQEQAQNPTPSPTPTATSQAEPTTGGAE